MRLSTGIFTLLGLLGLITLGVILWSIPSWFLAWFGVFLLVVSGLFVLGLLLLSGLMFKEKYLHLQTQRKAGQYQTSQDGYGMLHLINIANGHTQNLTIDARAYRNGHYEPPTESEVKTLQSVLAAKHASTAKMLLDPTPLQLPESKQVDLLSILTQPTQSYAFIGGQQVGKTFQANRIAQYWIQSGIKPIVIGPKWDKGEWPGCALFGGQYNFERVSQGMRIARQLATERHAHSDLSHKQHPIQPIFFDDWTGIRAKLEKEAEDFIIEATTLYASVNIVLYFILHLDTANAWGVGKVGAALHQNFIKLFIEPGYNEAGLIDRNRNTGYLLMPGQAKKDRRKVALFSGSGQTLLLPDLILQPSVNSKEAKIIALIQSGATDKEIALEVFEKSYLSGDNFYKVKELREKYA